MSIFTPPTIIYTPTEMAMPMRATASLSIREDLLHPSFSKRPMTYFPYPHQPTSSYLPITHGPTLFVFGDELWDIPKEMQFLPVDRETEDEFEREELKMLYGIQEDSQACAQSDTQGVLERLGAGEGTHSLDGPAYAPPHSGHMLAHQSIPPISTNHPITPAQHDTISLEDDFSVSSFIRSPTTSELGDETSATEIAIELYRSDVVDLVSAEAIANEVIHMASQQSRMDADLVTAYNSDTVVFQPYTSSFEMALKEYSPETEYALPPDFFDTARKLKKERSTITPAKVRFRAAPPTGKKVKSFNLDDLPLQRPHSVQMPRSRGASLSNANAHTLDPATLGQGEVPRGGSVSPRFQTAPFLKRNLRMISQYDSSTSTLLSTSTEDYGDSQAGVPTNNAGSPALCLLADIASRKKSPDGSRTNGSTSLRVPRTPKLSHVRTADTDSDDSCISSDDDYPGRAAPNQKAANKLPLRAEENAQSMGGSTKVQTIASFSASAKVAAGSTSSVATAAGGAMKRKNPTLLAQQGRQWGAEFNTSKRARTSAPSRLSGKTIPLLESPMPSSATSSTDLQYASPAESAKMRSRASRPPSATPKRAATAGPSHLKIKRELSESPDALLLTPLPSKHKLNSEAGRITPSGRQYYTPAQEKYMLQQYDQYHGQFSTVEIARLLRQTFEDNGWGVRTELAILVKIEKLRKRRTNK